MDRIKEYRAAAIGYLYSRAAALTEDVDVLLDTSLRLISGLPAKPKGHDEYNGLLGKKPVVEQRKQCLKLLLQRLNVNATLVNVDSLIDMAVRVLNKLPAKPEDAKPYTRLFTLPNNEHVKNAKTSEKGIELIHSFESYRATTYKDPGSASGLPITGGWGSTRLNGKKLKLGVTLPKEVWDAQFERDLKYFEDAVNKYVLVPINQNQFDALVSWVYNCGVGVLTNSTAIRRLNNKDYKGAAEALQWYNKGANGKVLAGLVRRRSAEAKLFLS